MEDPVGTLAASVAQCIEQLHQNVSSTLHDKESSCSYSLKQLIDLIDTHDNAFSVVGSHPQAVPTLVSLLRTGSLGVKMQAATVLASLCKDDELRQKLLLGGCIPPLLGLLRSSLEEGQIAAANVFNAVSQGGARDHVGLSYVISSLGASLDSCSSPAQVADTLGALALTIMVYDIKAESMRASDSLIVEQILVKQLKAQSPFLVKERTIGALASLYRNAILSKKLADSEAKRLLVSLITVATHEVQDELISSLLKLCNHEGSLWDALQGREGVQLLISLLGLSEQQQECAVALLCLLSNEKDESKLAITAACGIPPLVQILEIGSAKAKEDSARILQNLCNHSEDIRACVESANAVPALLWLLKNGSQNGKVIAANTLNHLIRKFDTGTINQLTSLLTSDLPESKIYVLDVLKSLLSVAPLKDILHEGSAANDAIEMMIKIMGSTREETQAKSASVLAGLFDLRKDLRESSIAVKPLWSAMKLLKMESVKTLMESSCCLAAIFLSIKQNRDVAAVARNALSPLVALANSSVLEVAEQATRALANLFLDHEISKEAFLEEIIVPVTRVLREGVIDGRTHAAAAIARLLQSRAMDCSLPDTINSSGIVLALISLLECAGGDSSAINEALDALSFLSRMKGTGGHAKPALAVLAEHPHAIAPIVSCIADGAPLLQDRAIEILCKLCRGQPTALGETISSTFWCVSAISNRIINSKNTKIKIGGAALLICAAKVHHERVILALNESNSCIELIQSLVEMLNTGLLSFSTDQSASESMDDIGTFRHTKEPIKSDQLENSISDISGDNIAIWLLSVLACYDDKSKIAIVEAGAVEVLADKISQHLSQASQIDSKVGRTWVCALLLAILFQGRNIISAHATMKSVPVLANFMRLEEPANRYFAAQALASLVCNGSRGTLLTVANSGAAIELISLLGCAEVDIHDLLILSNEFNLVRIPEQVALERLFRVDEIRGGATSQKAIPILVDLLKPIPDRPGAPFLALGLLTQLAKDNFANITVMVESGALKALNNYLSLGPQDAAEETATKLLGILFDSAEIRKHESAYGAVDQLVAVLRRGGRGACFYAAKALESLFSSDHIRKAENAQQAFQPLVEILNTGMEREQQAAISALVRLLFESPFRAIAVADVEMNAVDALCRILSSNCTMELKGNAVELCCVLFGNTRIRSTVAAARCVKPLVSLLITEFSPAHHSVVRTLDKLLDDEQLAELVAAHGAITPLVGLLFGRNYLIHEAISRALVKLGKGQPACKVKMVEAGVIESILDILHEAPGFLCAVFAELLQILTNNTSIAQGPSAAKVVEPLLFLLSRSDFGPDGQHSALQVLVNILEHPNCRAEYSLPSSQTIEPLIPLLDSPTSAVQQLTAELFSHLLLEEHLQKDSMIQHTISPLVRALGCSTQKLQHKAIKALASIASIWPNEIAKEDGVNELSKVILLADPLLPHALWESATSTLACILEFNTEYYLEVPVDVLVRLLHSGTESTVRGALNALLVLESDNPTSAEAMVESGVVEALLELLRSHQCEVTAARLLEVLLNNVKISETKSAKSAVSPLSQYLLDPQTQAQHARLLATLALGALFQNEGLARTTDSVSACRALVNLLEDQPTEEMKVVAIRALQNLVMYSQSNKRAVAEAGGVQVVLDLISTSDSDTSVQGAMFVKLIFSNHIIQEYASRETVRAMTDAIEKDLLATGSVNEEYLEALNVLFRNFPHLMATEPATLSISHLVALLKTGSEATQEAALNSLFLLGQAWLSCPADVSKTQSVAVAEAVPLLQYVIQSGPPQFKEKAELILQWLPGNLMEVRLDIKDESGQTLINKGSGAQYIFLNWILTILSGLMIGYNFAILGLVVSMNDFLHLAFPKILRKNKLYTSSDLYCKYTNYLIVFLSYLAALMAFVSRFFTLLLCSKFGVKNVLRASYFVILIGALIVVTLPRVFGLGSGIMGLGLGVSNMVVQIYVYETSSVNNRITMDRVFASSVGVGISIGGGMGYMISNVYSWGWRLGFFTSIAFTGVLFLASFRTIDIPDSCRLRSSFRKFFQSQYRPPFLISIATQIFSSFSGALVISFFQSPIYVQLGLYQKTYIIYLVGIAVVSSVGFASSNMVFNAFGRRTPLLVGAVVMIISQVVIMLIFMCYMKPEYNAIFTNSIFIIIAMTTHLIASTTCFGAVGWLQVTFPEDMAWTSAILSSNASLAVSFLLAQLLPTLFCKLGSFIFLIFLVFNGAMLGFVYYFVPETKGKTLDDNVWGTHWYWKKFIRR